MLVRLPWLGPADICVDGMVPWSCATQRRGTLNTRVPVLAHTACTWNETPEHKRTCTVKATHLVAADASMELVPRACMLERVLA